MKYFNMIGKYTKSAFMNATEFQAAVATCAAVALIVLLSLV
jgi:hypothetical protein